MLIEPYNFLKDIFNDEEKAIDYLMENDYIDKYKKCNICNKDTKFYIKEKIFKCKNYKCRKAFSPFRGTIFSKMKLPINMQLHILYEFLKKTPCSSISSSLQVDKNTITMYNKIFRNYLRNKQKFNKNNKIGGRNKIVEIDESKIAKRKYNRGHHVEGAWVIGGIERSMMKNKIQNENRKLFLCPIEIRNSINIDNIVKKYVKKGTMIYTDLWKGYNNLKKLGYKHMTVNHSKHFKDPVTNVHTNHIEGTWSALKQSIIPRNRTKKDIVLHLREYQWRKRNREYNIWKKFLKD